MGQPAKGHKYQIDTITRPFTASPIKCPTHLSPPTFHRPPPTCMFSFHSRRTRVCLNGHLQD